MTLASEAEAAFDAAAARFRSLGRRWTYTKAHLDRAALRGQIPIVVRLREQLDEIELELDKARDELHAARRRCPSFFRST